MKLIVMIPALNEEATVAQVIQAIPRSIPGVDTQVVVVIDDGSTDRTVQVAREAGAVVVSHRRNMGVGAAFQTGLHTALSMGADVVVNLDADGQFDPTDIGTLIAPILASHADMATASRFKDPALIPQMPRAKRLGNHGMALLISGITGKRFHDVSCGFRAYSRQAALNLNLFGHFTYTQETFLDLSAKGLPIVEIPLQIRGEREFGTSRVARSLTRYAFRSSQIILRSVLDYRPLQIIGSISGLCFLAGTVLFGFLLAHYLMTGAFTPYKVLGFAGGFFFAIGLIIFASALVADMLVRMRFTQERMLFLMKSTLFNEKDSMAQQLTPASEPFAIQPGSPETTEICSEDVAPDVLAESRNERAVVNR